MILLIQGRKEAAKQILQILLEANSNYDEFILYLIAHEGCELIKTTKHEENLLDLIRLVVPEINDLIKRMKIEASVKIAPVTYYFDTFYNPYATNKLVGSRHDFIVLKNNISELEPEKTLVGAR